MKILMLLASWFPPDSRVEKEAISLSEEGHEVHILCYLMPGQQELESNPHFTVHRFIASGFFINKLSALALITPFYFARWKKESARLHAKYSFDAIHVHDLPLSKVGYYFKRKYNCKLVLDQHEFYSYWIKKTAHMNTVPGKIVSIFSNWEKYEKQILVCANLIVTVADPLRLNYIDKYQLNENKIITIPNTPTKQIYNQSNVNHDILEKYKNEFIIFYAGGIDILRNIDTAIIAMAQIRNKIPNARLVLCGRIVKPYNPFRTAEKYQVKEAITFEGWIPEDNLPSYIVASNVCFHIPPESNIEVNKTIATKIYQYAMMKKPIIVSKAKLMKEFVEKNNLGISIHSGNPEEFSNAVFKIYEERFKLNPHFVNDLYWEKTVSPLITAYNNL